MKIRYSGRHTAVDLVLPNGVVRVERNHTADVPDDIGKQLVAGPNWQKAGGMKRTQPEPDVTDTASDVTVETEQEG